MVNFTSVYVVIWIYHSLPMQDKAYIALLLNSLQQVSDSSREKRFIIKDNSSASKIDFCAEGFDWAVDPTKMAVFAAISGSEDSFKLGFTIWSKPFNVIKSLALSTCISKNLYSVFSYQYFIIILINILYFSIFKSILKWYITWCM